MRDAIAMSRIAWRRGCGWGCNVGERELLEYVFLISSPRFALESTQKFCLRMKVYFF